MSDDLKFVSPDESSFAWPSTEAQRRTERKLQQKQTRVANRLQDLRRYRQARNLARRWEAGDEDVTIQDIISVLLGKP
jgi:hypothetical protein